MILTLFLRKFCGNGFAGVPLQKKSLKRNRSVRSPGRSASRRPGGKTAAWGEAVLKAATGSALAGTLAHLDDEQHRRLEAGIRQIRAFWNSGDGDKAEFDRFVRANFARDRAALDTMFDRFETLLEQLDGHLLEVSKAFRMQSDLERGPVLPYDERFAGYDPSAHVIDDFFANKLAFTVLLNFPLTTLRQRLSEGEHWSRRQWAEVRLAQRFSRRIPSTVNLAIARAAAEANHYVSGYNIWMHHLVNRQGSRLFPAGLRLLSHWNLRDELKACYRDGDAGLAKQRTIQRVLERIVTQSIPAAAVDNPGIDWDPFANTVARAAVQDREPASKDAGPVSRDPEPDTRYEMILRTYRASKLADPFSPTAPTLIDRRFDEDREIPEEGVRKLLTDVLSSPLVPQVAALVRSRLGRPLEPFDIWYNGFRPSPVRVEEELDEIVARRYPDAGAFQRDIPALLEKLGFPSERARMIAENVAVDPARGSGHAMEAAMRSAPARLRTRIEPGGMNYKGFNVAMHELGHNVEQTLSLHAVDHTLLRGVPNTAFTEAFAFVFQARDLEVLGLARPDERSSAMSVLHDFWATYEIAGVALVDMAMWHWMYAHPRANAAELKRAVLGIARDVWNEFYAPVFGHEDVVLLAAYSHLIDSFLYLPDYPIGHLIAFQVERQMRRAGSIGEEFERMAIAGRIAPDLWMKNATGSRVSAGPLLEAAEMALKEIR